MQRSSDPTEEAIARVAHSIWEAAGRPEGCDHEHWMRARALIDDGRAETEYPGSTRLRAEGQASIGGGAEVANGGSHVTSAPGSGADMPGPRDPAPMPPTNSEGYVEVPSRDDVAAGATAESSGAPRAPVAPPARRSRRKPDPVG